MADRPDEPELCAHQREALRSPFPLGWFYFLGRSCLECEREAHDAWVAQVRERLLAGLEAAREGRPFEWEPLPDAAGRQCDRQVSALSPGAGDAVWEAWRAHQARVLPTETIDVAGFSIPIAVDPTVEAGTIELRSYAARDPADVWRNTLDLMADLERYRAEHGPFLRELRCTSLVSRYLAVKLPRGEATGCAAMTGVPVLADDEVPSGKLRLVYDDGTTRDLEIFDEAAAPGAEELVKAFEVPFPIEIEPPPVSNWVSDYLRWPGYNADGGNG